MTFEMLIAQVFKRMRIGNVAIAIAVLAAGATLMSQAPLPASIGVATMAPDGTITLRLRAEGEGGTIGEGNLIYRRGNPQYEEVLHHIGGLKPGETKPVPPWKD